MAGIDDGAAPVDARLSAVPVRRIPEDAASILM